VLDASIIALMMEAESTPETTVNFYQTTSRNNPEDNHLQCGIDSIFTEAEACLKSILQCLQI
jgi:hypothetical protein